MRLGSCRNAIQLITNGFSEDFRIQCGRTVLNDLITWFCLDHQGTYCFELDQLESRCDACWDESKAGERLVWPGSAVFQRPVGFSTEVSWT